MTLPLRRVMIIGSSGSGKSTLARLLGEILNLPVYHMDRDVYWRPGWAKRPRGDRIRQVERIVARDAWVFEGSNSNTYNVRAARADMLIWLDIALMLRLLRVIRRSVGATETPRVLIASCKSSRRCRTSMLRTAAGSCGSSSGGM